MGINKSGMRLTSTLISLVFHPL